MGNYQMPQRRTWAQSIYKGADRLGNVALGGEALGFGAMHVPDPSLHTQAAGATLLGCAKVVKGVCVVTKMAARMAGGGPQNAYQYSGDAGGMLEGAGQLAGELGRETMGEYGEAASHAIAGGRLAYQGLGRMFGRRTASTDRMETAEDVGGVAQGGYQAWEAAQGMIGG